MTLFTYVKMFIRLVINKINRSLCRFCYLEDRANNFQINTLYPGLKYLDLQNSDSDLDNQNFRSSRPEAFCKMVFLEFLQNSQGKKETLATVFSCEFCEIFKNTFFTEHLWTTASKGYFGNELWKLIANYLLSPSNNNECIPFCLFCLLLNCIPNIIFSC